MLTQKPLAPLDRGLTVRGDEAPGRQHLSDFRAVDRYLLLGEPGSGKSRAFEHEALIAGTKVVAARDFVRGGRPPGSTVFIDALEEYRIGEAGVDRLDSLVDALANAGYSHWRIACRAISMPPPDARRIASALGVFATLQLEPLDTLEQRAILAVHGETDPRAFIDRVSKMGAGALLGNPSTLLLLRDTIDRATAPITTRGALLAEATRQMAHEINEDMPERSDRPPASEIIAAAERACIVLLLSDRSDIWMLGTSPAGDHFVTRDDLLPARIDTQALRFALDTPLFTGDGLSFIPNHRFVAEYLAGRALAHATAPDDPLLPALSLERAIAFLNGDNDRPAPALTGIFAWFAITLAGTVHADRALDLIRCEPTAILFHGDAAMLPTRHRRALLDSIGRDDPWFLGGNRGSTGVAGLAGDDIAPEMRAILESAQETSHRRALVLMALAAGRSVIALADVTLAIFAAPNGTDFYDRRTAGEAYARIMGATPDVYAGMLERIADQNDALALQLKIELLAHFVPDTDPDGLRDLLVAYGRTGDGVLGYAITLSTRLRDHPMPALFDRVFEVKRHTGSARYHEIAGLVEHALAAAIPATADLTADRLLDWLDNVGLGEHDQPEKTIVAAIAVWLDADPSRELALIDALSVRHAAAWEVLHDYSEITGRHPTVSAQEALIARVDRHVDADARIRAAQIALQSVRPYERHETSYWHLWNRLSGDPALSADYDLLTCCSMTAWQVEDAKRKRKHASERATLQAADRSWYRDNLEEVRRGGDQGLVYPAGIYLGHHGNAEGEDGPARLRDWVGDEATLAILEGWRVLVHRARDTAFDAGRTAAEPSISQFLEILICWADNQILEARDLDVPAPFLLTIAHYGYMAPNTRTDAMIDTALGRLLGEPDAETWLLDFWRGAIVGGIDSLPFVHRLDKNAAAVKAATERLLATRPVLRERLLSDALELAARTLPPATLQSLARAALARPLPLFARQLWAFTAWALDGDDHPHLLDCEFAEEAGHLLFGSLFNGTIGKLAPAGGASGAARLETIVARLGPLYPPSADRMGSDSRPSGLVSAALTGLMQNAMPAASASLARLVVAENLDRWRDSLLHAREQQTIARRQAEFRPPDPRKVASALLAGPPATPGDLRAVVVECLNELAQDIRTGPTAPWKGYWNRPWQKPTSPRIENDCRDLLVDRLSDRLRRFNIPVGFSKTEDRSLDDRRADVLVMSGMPILAGKGPAAIPIEAKRHWNSELWTAVEDQLLPYCSSAGSNGHGIFLVFWFGAKWPLPKHPDGAIVAKTPEALKAALEARLPAAHRTSIKVIVIDVSEPKRTAAVTKGKAKRAAAR